MSASATATNEKAAEKAVAPSKEGVEIDVGRQVKFTVPRGGIQVDWMSTDACGVTNYGFYRKPYGKGRVLFGTVAQQQKATKEQMEKEGVKPMSVVRLVGYTYRTVNIQTSLLSVAPAVMPYGVSS